MGEAVARIAERPRLAELLDAEQRYSRLMHRSNEMRHRSLEHKCLVLEAWFEAGQQYLAELWERSGKGGSTFEPRQAAALWTEIANRHMLKTQRSEVFFLSQRAMVRASRELRAAQSGMTEFIGEKCGLPTRTELDVNGEMVFRKSGG